MITTFFLCDLSDLCGFLVAALQSTLSLLFKFAILSPSLMPYCFPYTHSVSLTALDPTLAVPQEF